MMISKDPARHKRKDSSDKGKLLNEIESLSKALYLDKNPSKTSTSSARSQLQPFDKSNSPSKHSKEVGQSNRDKKSFWNWKPLKALSHVRNRRFNCCFSLHVHTIKGLPSKFNDTSICVHWKRRDGEVVTNPIKVVGGVAEFEERLTHTCSVYGSRSGPYHSAKYEAKHFLLYAAIHRNSKLDLGKHRVDLTRLLPLTLEELEDEKTSGTWSTTFKLSGEAKGAFLNVSFGYLVLEGGLAPPAPNNKKALQLLDSKASTRGKNNRSDGNVLMRRAESLPVNIKSLSITPSLDDVKVVHEVLPSGMSDFSNSVNMLYQKLEEGNLDSIEDKCEIAVPNESDDKPIVSLSHYLSFPIHNDKENDENSEFSFVEKVVEGEKSRLVGDGVKDVDDRDKISPDFHVVSGQQEIDLKIDEFVVQENTLNDLKSKLLVEVDDRDKISSDFHVVSGQQETDFKIVEFVGQENTFNDQNSELLVEVDDRDKIISDFSVVSGQQEIDLKIDEFVVQENTLNDQNSELLVELDDQDQISSDFPLVSGQQETDLKIDKFVVQENTFNDQNSELLVEVDDRDTVSSYFPVVSGQQETDFKFDEFVVKKNTFDDQSPELLVPGKGVEILENLLSVEEGEKVADDQGLIPSDRPLDGDVGPSHQEVDFDQSEIVIQDCEVAKENNICTTESILEDLKSVFNNVCKLEKEVLDSPDTISERNHQEYTEVDDPDMMMPSLTLDNLTENVADEFLSMLGIEDSSFTLDSEGEPESPRERLLREFEREALASGCSLFGFGIDEEFVEDDEYYAPSLSGWAEFDDDLDYLAPNYSDYPKIRANVVENLETRTLMEEWGLDENAFQSSQPMSKGGFESRIDEPLKEPTKLPPLGEGLGPVIQTKSGGFLRSMNPTLFKDAKSGGTLIMQVSCPIVVPAEIGSGVMDVVQHLASMGIEKLSIQANKLMPLEDVSGRMMQQIVWEASESQKQLPGKPNDCHVISTRKNEVKKVFPGRNSKNMGLNDSDSEFASLEDLAPLAIDKIEALSIEGLRIQSGMSDEEAPSNISAQSIGEFSTLEGKRVISMSSMGLEGAAGLKLLALEYNEADVDDGLMGLSLTLDEWMKLDSGEIDEDERLSERTSKLLAAHHAKATDLNVFRERKKGRRCGLLGNNFTVALMVQLRDPLRDYEPVGTPMLALIQVERVFVPPKPKIYCRVSEARDDDHDHSDEDNLKPISEQVKTPDPKEEKIEEEDLIPQYKINEVHVSGLKSEPGKKKSWGSAAQQQSGSRWLLANGMGKGGKTPFMKPKIGAKSSLPSTITSQPGDTLWSISARYMGSGAKWKELAALNPHIRNPNVIISNKTIKLR